MSKDPLENRTILVTGGAGFLGSHLVSELLRRKNNVICFDDLSTGKRNNIREFLKNKNFHFIKGDVNNFNDLKKAFNKYRINYVFHYAARVGVLRTIKYPLDVLKDIDGIKYILELAHKNKVEKIIFSSSSEIYGEPVESPQKEDGYLNPKLPYGTVKMVGENYFKAYHELYGLKTCSLRFFNVYGPKQESSAYGFVVGIFIKQALDGRPLTVFGDGKQTRDFVFIGDNIQASIAALLSKKTDGQSINVGIGRPVTILELAKKIIKISGNKNLKIKFLPLRPKGEIKFRFPDVAKMRKSINYKPMYSLEKGLGLTFDWYRKNWGK